MDTCLDRGEVGPKELIGGEIRIFPCKLPAHIGLTETSTDPRPMPLIADVMPKPIGESGEAVLLVIPTRNAISAVVVRDNEGEDEDGEEKDD